MVVSWIYTGGSSQERALPQSVTSPLTRSRIDSRRGLIPTLDVDHTRDLGIRRVRDEVD